MAPQIHEIKRERGVAGQYAYRVRVSYPEDGDSTVYTVRLIASTYGGPIVQETDAGQVFVSYRVTERLGDKLTPEWIRRYFGEGDES